MGFEIPRQFEPIYSETAKAVNHFTAIMVHPQTALQVTWYSGITQNHQISIM